jgi:DNA-binding MarR family transcriptional regulator
MAARKVTRFYEERLRPVGLKATQFTLLVAISAEAAESISELAEALAMDRTTLSRNLKLMEKRGLIAVAPEGYRRIRHVEITGEGRRILREAVPIWEDAQEALAGRFGHERLGNVVRDLSDLASVD